MRPRQLLDRTAGLGFAQHRDDLLVAEFRLPDASSRAEDLHYGRISFPGGGSRPFVVVSQATWRVMVANRIKGLRGGRTPFYEITLSKD